jgi:GST-like protein
LSAPSPSFTLWGARTGNSLRAAVGLCEAGVRYTARRVDFASGENRSPPYLAINPAGKTPVLTGVQADGARLTVTQSNAILFFADQQAPGGLLPLDPPSRTRALERYFYFVTDVIPLNAAAFVLKRSRHEEASAAIYAQSLRAIADAERFVAEAPYMGGTAFSLADVSAFTIINAVADDLPWSELPALDAWRGRIAERPAVQQGLHAFD